MSEIPWRSQNDARSMLQFAINRWSCWSCHHLWLQGVYSEPEPCASCRGSPNDRVLTQRKLRLLACGFCRAAWDDLTGDPAREAVVVAERYADGLVTEAALARARQRATAPAARDAAGKSSLEAAVSALDNVLGRLKALHEAELTGDLHSELARVHCKVEDECGHLGRGAVKRLAKMREQRFRDDYSDKLNRALTADRRRLAGVLHDIVGDPSAPVPIREEWLLADNGRARQVAAAIYADGDFEAMPVLADALQDAGCGDVRLLDHCLQDEHYRGCWLLDALLGRR